MEPGSTGRRDTRHPFFLGMLALVTLQTTISKGSGVSAQRSEALRLASEKMECLRSFTQIATGTASLSGRR